MRYYVMALVCLLTGCEAQELTFDEPVECASRPHDIGEGVCYYPDGCCELGQRGLVAICEEYLPGFSVPTMCTDVPLLSHCGVISKVVFDCNFGDSVLLCCKPDVSN